MGEPLSLTGEHERLKAEPGEQMGVLQQLPGELLQLKAGPSRLFRPAASCPAPPPCAGPTEWDLCPPTAGAGGVGHQHSLEGEVVTRPERAAVGHSADDEARLPRPTSATIPIDVAIAARPPHASLDIRSLPVTIAEA